MDGKYIISIIEVRGMAGAMLVAFGMVSSSMGQVTGTDSGAYHRCTYRKRKRALRNATKHHQMTETRWKNDGRGKW